MTPYLNLLAVLNLLGAAQGFLLALALLTARRGERAANRLLAALTLSISVFVSGAVLRTTGYVFVFPHLAWVHDPFPFAAGPLLYLYMRARTRGALPRRRDLLHFVPAALCALYLLPFYFQSADAKLAALNFEYTAPTLGRWYYVRSTLVVAHFLAYLVAVIVTLWKYTRRLRAGVGVSASDRAALAQVRFLVASCLVIWVAAVLRFALDHTARTNLLVPLLVSAVVYGLGYMTMTGRDDADAEVKTDASEDLAHAPAAKYERSTLTPERAERYLKRLVELMESERPYADGDLTLQKLAERLSIPAQHLSQTLNGQLKRSFTDFVNAYRVEDAKRRLTDPKLSHYSVLAIAEDVGFNSKSAFNAVFKKHTGMTPSEFRNNGMMSAE